LFHTIQGCQVLVHVARYHNYTVCQELPTRCQMTWNYFAPGHGKGEVDGAGALLKRELSKEQIKPDAQRIQSANDVVLFLRGEANKYYAAHDGARRRIQKHCWEIKQGDIDRLRPFDCLTMKGSQKSHQVRSVSSSDSTLIEYRSLSYSCLSCDGQGSGYPCEQAAHVLPWSLHKLKPVGTSRIRYNLRNLKTEVEFGSGGEEMLEVLFAGDNIAVLCESVDTNEDFWLITVDMPAHTVVNTFIDGWNQTFYEGESVVRGKYYERVKEGSRSYYLFEDAPRVYQYSHLVVASKFAMPPTTHSVRGRNATYESSLENFDIINVGIRAYRLADGEEQL
jgi:hypothetical protein